MKIEVVDVLNFEEKIIAFHDFSTSRIENHLELFDKPLTEEGLRDFLIDLYQLPDNSGLVDDRGYFNGSDHLSYYLNDDNMTGHYTVRIDDELIEVSFEIIKALNIEGKYYKLEELNL